MRVLEEGSECVCRGLGDGVRVCEEGREGECVCVKKGEYERERSWRINIGLVWYGVDLLFDLVLFRKPRTAVARDFQYCLHLTV